MPYSLNDLLNILPPVIVIGWACVLLLVDLLIPKSRKGVTAVLAALGMLAALAASAGQLGTQATAFNGMVVVDGFSVFLNMLVLGSGLLAVALAHGYLKRMQMVRGEFYILMLFSISGAMLMAMAADLVVVFLSLELLSIPLYVMSAFAAPNEQSEEAGMKYFLLGAFAGGFLLYGIALIYGATATTELVSVVSAVQTGMQYPTFLLVGAALILIGLGFKIAAVPFHMWTPDVYQGAPTPVTAFMAVAAKIGGFAALLRIFMVAFPGLSLDLSPVLWAVVVVTLLVGNLAAISQKNIKRMLAYSSISHAGFILMALVPYGQDAVFRDSVAAVLFYLLAFAIASFGSWAVVMALEKAEGKGLELDDYAGLSKKYPGLALSMLVFMLSFTGVPPTLGFAGKFFLFRAVLEGGYVWLAIIGVLASMISAYYYLRVVIIMYMRQGEPEAIKEPWLQLVMGLSALGTVALLLVATPLFRWAAEAVLYLY